MNAKEARLTAQTAERHAETAASIDLIEKLIEGEASRGKFDTCVELTRNIALDAAKHLRAKGFMVRITSKLGTHTLWISW